MSSCKESPFFDIEKTIEQYRSDMSTYLTEAVSLIDNWELYKQLQNNNNELNEVLPKLTAVHAFNTVQKSLIFRSRSSGGQIRQKDLKSCHVDGSLNGHSAG